MPVSCIVAQCLAQLRQIVEGFEAPEYPGARIDAEGVESAQRRIGQSDQAHGSARDIGEPHVDRGEGLGLRDLDQ